MKGILNFLLGKVQKTDAVAPKQEEPQKEIPVDKKQKIQRILNVFETGTPDGKYGNVSIFNDGPGNVKQISFGRSQTTQHSNLQELINDYISNGGKYSDEFRGVNFKDYNLVYNKRIIDALKKSGDDPIMRLTQDRFFDRRYWEPAMKWAEENGFTLPISQLVIYDSFIHSGGILSFLRKRFSEKTPINGGDEIEWIRAYLKTRHNWLATHSRPILRKTIYRTSNMINHLETKDYQLNNKFFANGTWVQ